MEKRPETMERITTEALAKTFIDEQIILYDQVCISGGQRGIQIKLNPQDLIKATGATVVDLELEK